MKKAFVLLLFVSSMAVAMLAAGCASAPPPLPPAETLLHDELFHAPTVRIDPRDALAMSPAMHAYALAHMVKRERTEDTKHRLIEALYKKGDLQLEYDAAFTRTAAQAFEARSGNCLALVLMTSAFAQDLGLNVRYQLVLGEPVWERTGNLYISIGHVNLSLSEPRRLGILVGNYQNGDSLVVDFLPSESADLLRTRDIRESTVLAMFLNNRAVEALTQGSVDDAYWWAREAVRTDPNLLISYTTLGVIYQQRHHPDYAQRMFETVIAREPENVAVLTNEVVALRDLGRIAEAGALQKRVDELDPHPVYSYFNAGIVALKQHRLEDAKNLFLKEVDRAPTQHEFQFWLAITYAQLNENEKAAAHMKIAVDMSTTRRDHDLYAAKLNLLKAHGLQ